MVTGHRGDPASRCYRRLPSPQEPGPVTPPYAYRISFEIYFKSPAPGRLPRSPHTGQLASRRRHHISNPHLAAAHPILAAHHFPKWSPDGAAPPLSPPRPPARGLAQFPIPRPAAPRRATPVRGGRSRIGRRQPRQVGNTKVVGQRLASQLGARREERLLRTAAGRRDGPGATTRVRRSSRVVLFSDSVNGR